MNKQKEILAALELIKQTCNNVMLYGTDCDVCPFYNVATSMCIFKNELVDAAEWDLNTPDRPWHAVF